MQNLRNRYIFFTCVALIFVTLSAYYLTNGLDAFPPAGPILEQIHEQIAVDQSPTYPKYKPESKFKATPIVDNFPLAVAAQSSANLPSVPSWNLPKSKHPKENTPLFIGFTRNWRILQQVVVSYITAGWPASDIYVVENTGVMDSNEKGLLSLQNPFFLNHTRLNMFGVNTLRTPTLLTFAQLQNFYLHHSIQEKWPTYFWSHMDVVAISFEDQYAEAHPDSLAASHDHSYFKSIYENCVDALHEATTPDPETSKQDRWAMRFFSYDRLALVNVAAFIEVGGWDTLIPFYMTDCDMHARLEMAGFKIEEQSAGMVFDVASSLDDLLVLYRKNGTGVEASFKDPNLLEEELKAAAAKEKETARKEEAKATNRDPKEKDLEAWKDFAIGAFSSLSGSKAKWQEDDIHSEEFMKMIRVLDAMQGSKSTAKAGRNTWQGRQTGGMGDPFYRDSAGFERGIQMTIEHGRAVFGEKWGHRDCDIVDMGLTPKDAWKVEHDWRKLN